MQRPGETETECSRDRVGQTPGGENFNKSFEKSKMLEIVEEEHNTKFFLKNFNLKGCKRDEFKTEN